VPLPIDVVGDGPDLVLVHGRSSSAGTWDALLPHLRGYRLHLVELLGHGRAPDPVDREAYSMQAQTEALAEALAPLDPGFAMLGHSMGGFVALRYVLQHPGRVGALALEGTSADNPYRGGRHAEHQDAMRRQVELVEAEGLEALADALEARGELHPRQRANLMAQTDLGYVATMRAIRDMEPLSDRVGEIKAPTLVLCGLADDIFLPECRLLAERIPGARGAWLPGAGHSPHREAPERFAAELDGFLAEVMPARLRGAARA